MPTSDASQTTRFSTAVVRVNSWATGCRDYLATATPRQKQRRGRAAADDRDQAKAAAAAPSCMAPPWPARRAAARSRPALCDSRRGESASAPSPFAPATRYCPGGDPGHPRPVRALGRRRRPPRGCGDPGRASSARALPRGVRPVAVGRCVRMVAPDRARPMAMAWTQHGTRRTAWPTGGGVLAGRGRTIPLATGRRLASAPH